MIASQPVSEALLPVYNQLRTLKRCLTEVMGNGSIRTVREVYPYSMKVYISFPSAHETMHGSSQANNFFPHKLNSIDNMRVDGKFMVGDDIPEGQGRVTELLEDCFDLSRELKIAAEAAEAQASSTDLESRTASEAESDEEEPEEEEEEEEQEEDDESGGAPVMKPHNEVPIHA